MLLHSSVVIHIILQTERTHISNYYIGQKMRTIVSRLLHPSERMLVANIVIIYKGSYAKAHPLAVET